MYVAASRNVTSFRPRAAISDLRTRGFGERLKGGTAYPDGSPVEIDGAPGSYKARPPVEAGTAAALVADYEREAALARAPYLQLLCRGSDAAEVQGHSTIQRAPNGPRHISGAANLWQVFSRPGGYGAPAGSGDSTPVLYAS